MSKLIKTTNALYQALINPDGTWAEQPRGILQRKQLPEENMLFLKKYLEFMMHSALLNDAAKIYIRSPYMTAKAAFSDYNSNNPDKLRSINTLISGLDYCRKKVINTVFPDDMLYYVIELPHKANMPEYWELLNKAIEKYSRKSLDADIMLLKLPKGVTNSAPSTERLVSCLTALAPYRKTTMKQREAEMKTEYADVIGYINYLAGCAARTSEEGRVFDMIHDFLNGDNSALGGLEVELE